MTRFRQPTEGEYLHFRFGELMVWSGGLSALSLDEVAFLRSSDPLIFVFDFQALTTGQQWWQTRQRLAEVTAIVRDVATLSLGFPQHLFVVLADPRDVFPAFDNLEVALSALSKSMGTRYPGQVRGKVRGLFKNLFIGCRLPEGPDTHLYEVLPWLMAIPHGSRFLFVDKQLPPDFELTHLRPCGDDLPVHGDFDVLSGEVFHASAAAYRDSINAHITRYDRLAFVIVDLGEGQDKQTTLASNDILYDCERHDVPCIMFGSSKDGKLERGDSLKKVIEKICR